MCEEKIIACIVGELGLSWADEDYTEGAEVHLPASVAVQLSGEGLVTLPADAFPAGTPDPEQTPPHLEAAGEQEILEDVTAEPTDEPEPVAEVVTEPHEVRVSPAELKELAPHGLGRWFQSEEFAQFLVDSGFHMDSRIGRLVDNDTLVLTGQTARQSQAKRQ